MPNKDTSDPNYYHKVVDCQWACPAHTPVPEYIRLIAEGRFADAYMVNRDSNVFPGILGRVCDRPCEPACRRGRVEKEPVAICRLKRVAADFKGDIKARLPKIPAKKNGKHIALIGAGPASLTVANDLMPLGYEVTLFEKEKKLGGAMRSNVPMFRLPEEVLDEEIDMIIDMGVKVHHGKAVTSLKSLLGEQKFDAVFIGSGAPIGRDLKLPGLDEARSKVHIGIEWLANVAFEHVDKIEKKVLVIGGGNTAMDCCRTAKRIGGKDVKVIAPESYEEMLASPWEKVDAKEENIEFINHLLPKEYVIKGGKLVGVKFQHLSQCYDKNKKWAPVPSGQPDVVVDCEAVILAIGQERSFPYIERDIGVDFDKSDKPIVDQTTYQSSHKKVFFGGDAAFGPKNIIWAVAHGHAAAISIDLALTGKPVDTRPLPSMKLVSQKMGVHEWSYSNDYSYENRVKVPHEEVEKRLKTLDLEVELGYDVARALAETSRCLNCDVQTVFSEPLCIECDACVDICPLNCLTMTAPGPIDEIKQRLSAPAIHYPAQEILISDPLKDTKRVMVKDEDLCVHCGLCAERCPTGAWDMQKMLLHLPKAGALNG